MRAESELYYLCVPRGGRVVGQPVEFLSINELLEDEPACKAIWQILCDSFHTRSKFLAIWPSVRFVALVREAYEVVGFLLVSALVNWQIDYVAVRPDMQGRGLAAALVDETLKQAFDRGVPYVMLTSKESLRRLYEGRCGFSVVGRREAEAAVLLESRL
jgi:ribosomal protein S18 acetylase RimI-like enzyme